MSNQIEWRAKAAGGVGDVCSAFSAAGILLSQPRFDGAAGGVGAVPLAATLEKAKMFCALLPSATCGGTQSWFSTTVMRSL